jgi:hypothetical protein
MRLWYFLRSDTPLLEEMAIVWEDAAAEFVRSQWAQNELIEVHVKHSRSYDLGLTSNANRYPLQSFLL